MEAKSHALAACSAACGLSKMSTRMNVIVIATIAVAPTILRASSRKWGANVCR